MTTEARVRAIVREEIRRARLPRDKRRVSPCGKGDTAPRCMGSAARGPDYCVCPGVHVEYYR